MKLRFDSRDLFYKDPFGAVAVDTVIAFRVEIAPEEGESPGSDSPQDESPEALRRPAEALSGEGPGGRVKKWTVGLLIREDGGEPTWIDGEREERPLAWDGAVSIPTFRFSWAPEKPGLFFFRFRLLEDGGPADETQEIQLTVYKREYHTPKWLSEGLMYQIFPDRFARSRHYQPPAQEKNYYFHESWGGMPFSGPDENGIVWNNDFFGGNLRGIEEQLPYLEELGVTVIYLNPIFRAFSNHRYDTANYLEIDPMLGTEADFASLCANAQDRGIRIIIDGVFNHTGSHSIYFNRDGAFPDIGACQGPESPYYKWYHFTHYPDKYDCWWGIDTLPAVNEMEDSYRDFIIRGENSVIKHWLRLGASGIRLDVADELPDAFIAEVRDAVRSVRADGAVIGEVWEDASNKIAYGRRRRYFQGDELDSVMNYPLKDQLIHFINDHKDGQILQNQIVELMEHYPPAAFRCLMNILGTHDTQRILTVFSQGGADPAAARQKLFLALLVWAFVPGIPCIYYGDELGMEGGRDPENRSCFEPRKGKREISLFYRRLLYFRKQIPGLSEMAYVPGESGPGYFSFERRRGEERVYLCLNLSPESRTLPRFDRPGEKIVDFVNSGEARLLPEKTFLIGPLSGIAMHIV